MELHIYRDRVMLASQGRLFDSKFDLPTVLRRSVLRRLTAAVNKRIGNMEPVGDGGLYFRAGRRSKLRVPVYDQPSQSFVDQEMQRAPHAHVLLDSAP